mmetsp:Transcript_32644/g.23595  ORF Transcript_32644/g.23595 Transcript_32644/m.23595 type:complete len:119 (+) Transcript_32644:637-993(+)
MNTILSASSGGVSIIFVQPLFQGFHTYNKYNAVNICNAILVALVSITAVCHNCEPWASIVIGIGGSFFYCIAIKFCDRFEIDDPLEALHIHGFGGLWGLIAVGIFDLDKGLIYGGTFN